MITRLAEDGISVFGVNYTDTSGNAAKWLERHGDPYSRIGADVDRRFGIEMGLTDLSETFVVDRTGVIRFKHVGPLTPETLEETLIPAIKSFSATR